MEEIERLKRELKQLIEELSDVIAAQRMSKKQAKEAAQADADRLLIEAEVAAKAEAAAEGGI